MTPEQYNRTVGLNLALTILETVKELNRKGEEATNRSVCDAIAPDGMSDGAKNSLYNRIRGQMRTLEASGRVTRKEERDKYDNVYYKSITYVG